MKGPNVSMTGFYYGTPSENEQLFGASSEAEYKFVGEVAAYDRQANCDHSS